MTVEHILSADVGRYGVTIAPIAARLLGVHTQRARRLLEGLVRAGELRRFTRDGAAYFTNASRPLSAPELRQRFAVAWFCHMTNPPVELLSATTVVEVIAPLLPHLGLSRVPSLPAYVNRETGRLSVVVVAGNEPPGRSPNLQHAMRALQRLAASQWFRPWVLLAASEQCELTYLHARVDEIPELARWIAMHPLYGRMVETVPAARMLPRAVRVPVRLAALVTLAQEPEKTKAHEGLLSPALRRTTV